MKKSHGDKAVKAKVAHDGKGKKHHGKHEKHEMEHHDKKHHKSK